jgi:glycosyltransferase involved in cell wall biosynthesis
VRVRLLIVAPAQDRATGNWVTAERLRHGVAASGHAVHCIATDGTPEPLRTAVASTAPELVLLLHAWRSGRPWLASGCSLPYVVLLTGTDANHGLQDPSQAPLIETVLQQAAAILSQNPATVTELRRSQPALAPRLHLLPPGIRLGTTPYPDVRTRLSLRPGELLCLCPAGIRPVKGLIELLALCEPLIREGRRIRLAFCGPIIDVEYGARFLNDLAARPWAVYLGVVPPDAMPALLCQADLVISNSASEGLPNALVEAAVLGRPIVASAIPGHAAVVTDGANGLLFDDPPGFHRALRRLSDEPGLLRSLSRPEPLRYTPEREAAVLEKICRDILAGRDDVRAQRNVLS